MKYHDKQLREEINSVLDTLAAQQAAWRPVWITHEICQSHRIGLVADDNEHVAFWEFNGYSFTRKLVTEVINERADQSISDKAAPQQLSIPGFAREHLQDYYVVTRENEDIAVCVLDLTDDEINAKAALYRSHARKAIAHAEELERFADFRRVMLAKAAQQ